MLRNIIIAISACLLLSLGCWLLSPRAQGQEDRPPAPPSVGVPPSEPPVGYQQPPSAPQVPSTNPPRVETGPLPAPPVIQQTPEIRQMAPAAVAPKSRPIWSFTIEDLSGRTVVRASIGRKNELTIHCDNVDLQTQQGSLKAQGKIVISAAGFHGTCEELTIHLGEDTVLLNGAAAVGIWRQAQGETARVGLVELKAQQLSLRWPELLQVAPVVHSGMTRSPVTIVPETPAPAGEQFRPATFVDSPLPPGSTRMPPRPRPLPHDAAPETYHAPR